MHKLYKLKDALVKELSDYGEEGGVTRANLDTIDKLAHAAKNVSKVIECCEDEEYSSEAGYSRRMSHSDGNGSSYGDYYVRPDGSYARGRGAGARRDSMGRYSSEGGVDEHTKKELMKLIEQM